MKAAMTTEQLDTMAEKAGFIITSHPWYSNVQAAARVDLGATILAQLDGDTKIVQNKFGAYYVSRAGKAARCERVNGLYFRSSAR